MELALIPVAALLLLLTSMGSPAHATALSSTAGEVIQLFFPHSDDTAGDPAPPSTCRKTAHGETPFRLGSGLATGLQRNPAIGQIRPETLDKRASRFASASVTYRSTAPPAAC